MSENVNNNSVVREVRYTYIRDEDNSGRVLTIARRWGKHGKLHYAYALCRPDADQFERAIGRKIASGRLLEKPKKLEVETGKYAITVIMRDISSNEDTPRILRKIANSWLINEANNDFIVYHST